MASIIQTSRRNSKITTDIDTFKDRYIDSDKNNNITVTIPSFDTRTFEKSYFILLSNSERVKFKQRWSMRPDYTSFDIYNTTIYWQLLMWINKTMTIEEFDNFETILVPHMTSILELAKYRDVNKSLIPITEDVNTSRKINKYYKKYPLDSRELYNIVSKIELGASTSSISKQVISEQRSETFTLTQQDITNKYVDLLDEPSNASSLSMYYNNLNKLSLKYNYDYTLTYDDNNNLIRISWNVNDIIENNENEISLPQSVGLRSFVAEGDTLKVNYITNVTVII